MQHKVYTDADGTTLAFADGERLHSLWVVADGAGAATVTLSGFQNLSASVITVPQGKERAFSWNEPRPGAGPSASAVFSGLGHYVAQTVVY
jgi:hypothetical protein